MFSWPMIPALLVGGVLYSLTSVPQMPATSIFIKAASSGMSGMGYSRISVLLGPTLTAARTFSTTEAISTMIMTLVAGTLGVDLERSRAICTGVWVCLGLRGVAL